MSLTDLQRNELERLGVEAVTLTSLASANWTRRDVVSGFACGDIERSDLEQWMANEWRRHERRQARLRLWARVACLTMAGVLVLMFLPFIVLQHNNSVACGGAPTLLASAAVPPQGGSCARL